MMGMFLFRSGRYITTGSNIVCATVSQMQYKNSTQLCLHFYCGQMYTFVVDLHEILRLKFRNICSIHFSSRPNLSRRY